MWRPRSIGVALLIAMAILFVATLSNAQSTATRAARPKAPTGPRTRATGKDHTTPRKTRYNIALRGKRGEEREGNGLGRMGVRYDKKYVAMKPSDRPSLADPNYQKSIAAVATANKTCSPRDPDHFEVGTCFDDDRKNVCGNHHGVSKIFASGCDSDEVCCAASKNRRRYMPHVTEIDPPCSPRDPSLKLGKCVANAATCTAKGFRITQGSGCPSEKALCCVTGAKKVVAPKKISPKVAPKVAPKKSAPKAAPKAAPPRAPAAPTCNTPGVSTLSDFHFDFSWKINPPYVAWTETQMVKKLGVPIGVKIFFLVKIIITVKSDVLCVSCGTSTKYNDVGIQLEKMLKVPFKITGVRFLTSALGSVIPGLNVAIIAVQLVEAYETFLTIKHNVQALISAFQGTRDAFKCERNQLQASRGQKGVHGSGASTVVVIDIDMFLKKHHKRSIEEISAEDVIAAIGENVDITTTEPQRIILPEETLSHAIGEINVDEFDVDDITYEKYLASKVEAQN